MVWQKLTLDIPAHAREQTELAAIELGALAVTLEDGGAEPVLEPPPGTTPLWSQLRLTALFPDDVDRAAVAATPVLAAGTWSRLEDRDWERVWLQDVEPVCFGDRLWVCPHGQPAPADGAIVRLDPGLAFGTGRHATTALCLEWLATADLTDRIVLDYGCGSGILGLAAAALGARRIVATDIDAQALTATRTNAAANGVAGRFEIVTPEADLAPVDIALANILARPLIGLAGTLAATVRPGGSVVLSGILETQAAQVGDAYAPWFDMHSTISRDGWSRLHGIRSDRVYPVPRV